MSRSDSGFTLIEILVAFSILLVGMTGIISLFSTGLSLDREGKVTFEGGVVLDELIPAIKRELREQIKNGVDGELLLPLTEVPSRPGLQYEAHAVPMPEDQLGRGFLLKVDIVSPRGGRLKRFSYGYLPVVLEPTHDELMRLKLK